MPANSNSVFARRTIGPAHERSPMEMLNDWGLRKMLFLISSFVIAAWYMYIVNWFCDSMLPAILGEGGGAQMITISSNNPAAVAAKLIGGACIIYLLHKQSTKR